MNYLFLTLAQVINRDPALPFLDDEYSTGATWMIIAALVIGILAIAFKSSHRTHLDE